MEFKRPIGKRKRANPKRGLLLLILLILVLVLLYYSENIVQSLLA